MEYQIHVNEASKVIREIFDVVRKGIDPEDKKIKTWSRKLTGEGEQVLIHTTDQWEIIGCISLSPNSTNDVIIAKFYYWDSYPKEKRNGDEEKYYLGRFTELMLVHFFKVCNSIVIR